MTDAETTLVDELDRRLAEELQDRLRREEQTARALREYLLKDAPD